MRIPLDSMQDPAPDPRQKPITMIKAIAWLQERPSSFSAPFTFCIGSFTEDQSSYPDHCRTFFDCDSPIMGHSHGQFIHLTLWKRLEHSILEFTKHCE